MPELPDLVHIVKYLGPRLEGKRIVGASVKEPIVLRLLVLGDFAQLVSGRVFTALERRGPFLRFGLGDQVQPEGPVDEIQAGGQGGSRNGLPVPRDEIQAGGLDLVMHLMLAGRLRLAPAGEKPMPFTAFLLDLDSGERLSYADEKNMGKIYLAPPGRHEAIPGFETQGVDVTSPQFTYELFESIIAKRRCQARVLVMDQTLLSAIGNAYADEILFEAGIHPKASCGSLGPEKKRALYDAIRTVLAWGVAEVEAAGAPLEDKVRGHMKVRNRAGEKCPRCGALIRRAGVLGYDSFFCPVCQPDTAGKGLDWNKLPK